MSQLAMPFATVPGVHYLPVFLCPKEADELASYVIAQPHWIPFGTRKRRLIYGFNYSVGIPRIPGEARPVPRLLVKVAVRLRDAGLMHDVAEQVVVQDYPAGIGIGRHLDVAAFGPEVVSISLLSSCVMRFREVARPRVRVDQ